MKTIVWNTSSGKQRVSALARPSQGSDASVRERVAAILQDVQQRGDAALRDYALKFDKVDCRIFRVQPAAIEAAARSIDPALRKAMKRAKANIEAFHRAELPKPVKVETMPGVVCEQHWRAIDTVGFYIPSGTAPLFSSLLMQAIPAKIAGCARMILCSPPQRDGKIHPAILAAAHLCGIEDVFTVGGAQAIGAMAYGTRSVPKVDKIFGPGNAYVAMAKQLVSQESGGAAIDMPAGPSEVMVVASPPVRPDWVAADLLAQAEHDADAQAILVTTDAAFGKQVAAEVKAQLALLPRRAIAAQSIAASRVIIVDNRATAIEVANTYAPEHLILHDKDAAKYLPQIRNAGSVFLGALTPEAAGDYASGTNHVLPTYGHARAYSGLNVLSFMKSMTVQSLTPAGLAALGPTIVTMAEAEELHAHANAITIRLST